MLAPSRIIVWLGVVAASVGVGWYISQAQESIGNGLASNLPGNYVFVAGGSDAYWDLCTAGAEAAANELGAKLTVLKPTGEGDEGMREQLDWLTSMGGDQYDGMAIGPIDPERQATQINAVSQKLTVVTVDSDAPSSRRLCYIGSSNYEAGGMAAQMVKESLPQGGKVVVLMASLAKTNAAERKLGFDDELMGRDDDEDQQQHDTASYQVVDYLMDQGDPERCKENVKNACENHEDLGAVVATFGYHGPAALETLEELGRSIPVVAFDEHQATLRGVKNGTVHATIVQDPFMFGAEAIKMLDHVRQGNFLTLPQGARVDVGIHCRIVKISNLESFKQERERQQ